jgi:hypothetical protein
VEIAKTILALEVLASGLAGWRANYPRASLKAEALLRGATRGPRMSLRQFYLYPAKHDASAATAAFFPPGVGSPGGNRLRYPWQAAMTGADLDIADDVGETRDAGLPDSIAELL